MRVLIRNLLFVFIIFISTIRYLNFSFERASKEQKTIQIEIRGEVQKEQIINVKLGSTLMDIMPYIELKEDADINNLSLNTALYNNQIINIRKKTQNKLVSINNGSIEELCTINGIGKKTAIKIINYRKNNGSFHTLEELMNVSGIGEKKFEQIREYITL